MAPPRRMRLVHAHLTDLMIVAIKDGDLVRLLQQLRRAFVKTKGTPPGQHWLRGFGSPMPLLPEFSVLLHDLRRLRLQDRIGVIAEA